MTTRPFSVRTFAGCPFDAVGQRLADAFQREAGADGDDLTVSPAANHCRT